MMRIQLFILAIVCAMVMPAHADDVMKKTDDGTYVINTTTICSARGFKSQTPVEVYIKKGKVVKVVALKNQESRGFFKKITDGLLPLYEDLKLSKAKELSEKDKVDATTGATFSSRAVQQNIQSALEYYTKHK